MPGRDANGKGYTKGGGEATRTLHDRAREGDGS